MLHDLRMPANVYSLYSVNHSIRFDTNEYVATMLSFIIERVEYLKESKLDLDIKMGEISYHPREAT